MDKTSICQTKYRSDKHFSAFGKMLLNFIALGIVQCRNETFAEGANTLCE
jgi:hypothetical protein